MSHFDLNDPNVPEVEFNIFSVTSDLIKNTLSNEDKQASTKLVDIRTAPTSDSLISFDLTSLTWSSNFDESIGVFFAIFFCV